MRASNHMPVLLGAALIPLIGCIGEPTDEWGGLDDTGDTVARVPGEPGPGPGPGSDIEKTFVGNLGMVLGYSVAVGNTSLLDDTYHPSCVLGSQAPDASYLWTAPFHGVFLFSTWGSIFDTVLEIRRISDGVSLGCDNDSGGTQQSAVFTPLAAGEAVLVYIDGYRREASRYRLSIYDLN